jgi:hypothetical protein
VYRNEGNEPLIDRQLPVRQGFDTFYMLHYAHRRLFDINACLYSSGQFFSCFDPAKPNIVEPMSTLGNNRKYLLGTNFTIVRFVEGHWWNLGMTHIVEIAIYVQFIL